MPRTTGIPSLIVGFWEDYIQQINKPVEKNKMMKGRGSEYKEEAPQGQKYQLGSKKKGYKVSPSQRILFRLGQARQPTSEEISRGSAVKRTSTLSVYTRHHWRSSQQCRSNTRQLFPSIANGDQPGLYYCAPLTRACPICVCVCSWSIRRWNGQVEEVEGHKAQHFPTEAREARKAREAKAECSDASQATTGEEGRMEIPRPGTAFDGGGAGCHSTYHTRHGPQITEEFRF